MKSFLPIAGVLSPSARQRRISFSRPVRSTGSPSSVVIGQSGSAWDDSFERLRSSGLSGPPSLGRMTCTTVESAGWYEGIANIEIVNQLGPAAPTWNDRGNLFTGSGDLRLRA